MSEEEQQGNVYNKFGLLAGSVGALIVLLAVSGYWWLAYEGDSSLTKQQSDKDDRRLDGKAPATLDLAGIDEEKVELGLEYPALEWVEANSVTELLDTLRAKGGSNWPPESEVMAVSVAEFPHDLADVAVKKRKEVFFRILTPIVLVENARLRAAREKIKEFARRPESLSASEEKQLAKLTKRYRVSLNSDTFFDDLLRRVDEIPVDLALAQAANESGWGTSRFTRQANNLFGEWTWTQEEGLIPKQRAEGKTHRIRAFDSLQSSVRSYFYTLNVGQAYNEFRAQRAAMREQGQTLGSHQLAGALTAYSERGQDYVEEIRAMINFNELDRLSDLQLVDSKAGR